MYLVSNALPITLGFWLHTSSQKLIEALPTLSQLLLNKGNIQVNLEGLFSECRRNMPLEKNLP